MGHKVLGAIAALDVADVLNQEALVEVREGVLDVSLQLRQEAEVGLVSKST